MEKIANGDPGRRPSASSQSTSSPFQACRLFWINGRNCSKHCITYNNIFFLTGRKKINANMWVANENLFQWMRDNNKKEDRMWSCWIFDENLQNILYNLHFIIEIKGESQSEFIEERKNCVNDFRCFRRSLWNCYSYVCEVFDWFYTILSWMAQQERNDAFIKNFCIESWWVLTYFEPR